MQAIGQGQRSLRRAPVKWDTMQRDILWKYQRRIQTGSLYVNDAKNGHTVEAVAGCAVRPLLPPPHAPNACLPRKSGRLTQPAP
eukprot:SAG25_NODE_1950_length_2105_cov_4.496012_1_plen_84_part_00